jgi:DNA-binding transcriptional LysR family regulator
MREQGSGTRELFERYMLEKGMPIRIALEGNSSDSIKKAVIENQFLAVISIRLVEEEIKNGKIHVIQNTDMTGTDFLVLCTIKIRLLLMK